jgi:hypothetical protein
LAKSGKIKDDERTYRGKKHLSLQAILQERTISDLPRFGNCDDESSKDGPSEVNKGVATFAFPDFMECHPERMRLV